MTMNNKLIQWPRAKYWDKCWNPVIGCRPCSPACEHCYARIYRERDKLRDLVRRMMPCVKERAEEWIRETDNPMGSSCGRMWREAAAKEAVRLSAPLREAKEALGERRP